MDFINLVEFCLSAVFKLLKQINSNHSAGKACACLQQAKCRSLQLLKSTQLLPLESNKLKLLLLIPQMRKVSIFNHATF